MELFSRKKKKEKNPPSTHIRHACLSYEAANLQGLGSRERQEDAFAFSNVTDVTMIRRKGLLAVVADGMGGMEDGALASQTVIKSLRDDFDAMEPELDLAEQLYNSILRANAQVFQATDGNGGSTVVACLFFGGRLYFASVGDSYLYLLRGGQLVRLNREQNVLHSRYLKAIRDGNVSLEEIEPDREDAALSQFLGMPELDEVDYLRRPLPLKDGDVLLLCSDGVGGVLSEETIMGCLREDSTGGMCTSLEEAILQEGRQYQDNYTALVIRCAY